MGSLTPGGQFDETEVRKHLEKVLSSVSFKRGSRSGRFLRLIVERTLEGRGETLKEYNLGLEVFDRDESFDPRIDSLVRVEATRLRARLKTYYEKEGASDRLRIELPRGGYAVQFVRHDTGNSLGPVQVAGRTSGARQRVFYAAALLGLAVLAAAVTVKRWWPVRAAAHPLVLKQATADSGLTAYASLSADGQWLVYSSDRGGSTNLNLWKQRIDGTGVTRLTHGGQDDTEPVFSLNGDRIAFTSTRGGGGVYAISAGGGEAKLVASLGRGPRFSPDGRRIVYWVRDPQTGFGRAFVEAIDEEFEPDQIGREFDDIHDPTWTSDGRHFLVCGTRRSSRGPDEEHDFWLIPVEGGTAQKLYAFPILQKAGLTPHFDVLPATSLRWLDKSLVFPAQKGEEIRIWRLAVSDGTPRAIGVPEPLTRGLDGEVHASFRGGKLALTNSEESVDIWTLPIDADRARVTGELSKLTSHPGQDLLPSISTRGDRMVFLSRRAGSDLAVWEKELSTGVERELAHMTQSSGRLKISGDGRWAFYRALEGPPAQRQAIYRVDLESGQKSLIHSDCGAPTFATQDGSMMFYETGSSPPRLGVLRAGSGEKQEFLRHAYHGLQAARLSPDGAWLAFQMDRGYDGVQILVSRFAAGRPPQTGAWIPVTENTGVHQEPWWSPEGKYIYYLSDRDGHRCVWAQELRVSDKRPAGPPVGILHLHTPRLTALKTIRRAPLYVGLSIAKNRLVLSLSEIRSNVFVGDM